VSDGRRKDVVENGEEGVDEALLVPAPGDESYVAGGWGIGEGKDEGRPLRVGHVVRGESGQERHAPAGADEADERLQGAALELGRGLGG
jgi:hypothetical protein